jgi:drug/metabolite transporter (DMT)-like permease
VPSSESPNRRAASPASGASHAALPPLGFVLLAALTLFWGANWPIMKIVLAELPVWWFRAGCLWFGGLGLVLIARLSRLSLAVPRGQRGPLLVCALFNVVGWHLLSGYGVSLMPAGRAAIIAFTMPLWASLLGSLVLGERLTPAKLIGLALGMIGLSVLIGPDLAALDKAPVGALFMLLGAVSWATGTVLLKRFRWSVPTTALVGWQLIAGAVPVSLGAVVLEAPPDLAGLSPQVMVALAYIIAFPMVFCQWAYYRTVRLFPAAIAAIGTLAIPVVGVYASALMLGEAVGWREFAALLLICSALASVLLPARPRPGPPG